MKSAQDLKSELIKINRKPYPAYKSLKGEYRFPDYLLAINHVQGDPFAAPSRLHVSLAGKQTGIPAEYCDTEDKRTAFADYCLREFGKCVSRYSFQAKGSGKSGLISVSQCGQQVLSRTSCQIRKDGSLLLRMEVGFPANGRTINSTELIKILHEYLPAAVDKSLKFSNMNQKRVKEALDLYEDQTALLNICKERGWISFVADGSVLPRTSGISQRPMKDGKKFFSPASMREEVVLPHRGKIAGMALKKGITLIVGGGYHGKSTLLNALETGIYHHIAGDGREYIVTDETAFKIRAEDGRSIAGTDISMFIADLPNGKDTAEFWTEDASGSTSQAANVAEALLSGSGLLLMDEDTSATNFMVRDGLMAEIIAKEKEPITPFIDRVRELYEKYGVSTVIVAGSSEAYFSIADKIIQMDCYEAIDITDKVREKCSLRTVMEPECDLISKRARYVGIKPLERKKGQLKAKQYSIDSFAVGNENMEIRGLEQLMDYEQTTTLAHLTKYTLEQMEKKNPGLQEKEQGKIILSKNNKGKCTLEEYLAQTWKLYCSKGMEGILSKDQLPAAFAEVRKQDFYACFYRYRGLNRV